MKFGCLFLLISPIPPRRNPTHVSWKIVQRKIWWGLDKTKKDVTKGSKAQDSERGSKHWCFPGRPIVSICTNLITDDTDQFPLYSSVQSHFNGVFGFFLNKLERRKRTNLSQGAPRHLINIFYVRMLATLFVRYVQKVVFFYLIESKHRGRISLIILCDSKRQAISSLIQRYWGHRPWM